MNQYELIIKRNGIGTQCQSFINISDVFDTLTFGKRYLHVMILTKKTFTEESINISLVVGENVFQINRNIFTYIGWYILLHFPILL